MRYFTKPILLQLITMEVLFFLLIGVCYLFWPKGIESLFFPLLFLYPLVAFLIPLYSFASRGFNPVWPWATFLLFLPPLFLIFNSSAMMYPVIYTAISGVGCAIGLLIYRYIAKRDQALGVTTEVPKAAV